MAGAASEPCSEPEPAAFSTKPIHSLVLDTGPIIKNDPPVSVIIARSEKIYTTDSVFAEVGDPATRARFETMLQPFLTFRNPRFQSVQFIEEFARRTGDLEVLNRTDLEVLALSYELECERNGGDWRLRKTPGQKRLNGRPQLTGVASLDGAAPSNFQREAVSGASDLVQGSPGEGGVQPTEPQALEAQLQSIKLEESIDEKPAASMFAPDNVQPEIEEEREAMDDVDGASSTMDQEDPEDIKSSLSEHGHEIEHDDAENVKSEDGDDEEEDGGGWITPSNLKKHRAKDAAGIAIPQHSPPKILQAAILTSDFAMQNVALRMNLNLVTPSLVRIRRIKNWVLRCHGCFSVTKDMRLEFCPSCGQPTLIRASCSTDEAGNFRVHLKKGFQWNKRGNVYSVPKPVHGSASGKLTKKGAGGKKGWGRHLMLAEDQKEYVRAREELQREKRRDPMDGDFLPAILSGDRPSRGGGIRVGAGRNVNMSRRKA